MNSLRVALQRKGRLAEDSLRLLSEAGIAVPATGERLRVPAIGYPLEVYLLRDDDIPLYVAEGIVDVGIVGENVYAESGLTLEVLRRLGFGRCRLSLAVPKESPIHELSQIEGRRIATSYPRLTRHFLAEMGLQATLQPLHGSTEIAPSLGLADAIVDIVATGSTLLIHGLREVHVFMHSEALLLRSAHTHPPALEDFLFRIDAVLAARRQKYILFNLPKSALKEAAALLPGLRSPTVLPLLEPEWVSMHTVVEENRFWEVAHKLQQLGAQGILVLDIEKLIR